MGYISVTITLTVVGTDLGPFNLYTDADNFVTPIVQGLSVAQLTAGYTCTVVPDTATIIRVKSMGICDNYIDLPISGLPQPTPTPTPTQTSAPIPLAPSPSATPTPTPTKAPGVYTVYFDPIIVEQGYYPDSSQHYKLKIKSYVYTSPALPAGHSFKIHFQNNANVSASEALAHPISATAERKVEGNSNSFDKAYASLGWGDTGADSDVKTGYIVITDSTSGNGSGNRIYFNIESIGHLTNDPEQYGIFSGVQITSVEEVTGGGTYILDSNDYLIESYVP